MIRLIILLVLSLPVWAVDDKPPQPNPMPEVPDLPMPVENGEAMEPDITITRKGQEIIQEYRRGGRLYMIKVIPDIGSPYYFRDYDGDGKLEARSNDLDRGSHVNMWKILEWD